MIKINGRCIAINVGRYHFAIAYNDTEKRRGHLVTSYTGPWIGILWLGPLFAMAIRGIK